MPGSILNTEDMAVNKKNKNALVELKLWWEEKDKKLVDVIISVEI